MVNLTFGNGEISTSAENKFYWNNHMPNKFDFLFFFDSRMMTINEDNYDKTILYKLLDLLKKFNLSYIIVSRPKNLTTFATLINFLQLNKDLAFNNLITNLGFVEYTPKKQTNVNDMMSQIRQFCDIESKINDLEDYQLNDGTAEVLKSIEYSQKYIEHISKTLDNSFKKIYFINTPIITESSKMERKRPNSFFTQLKKTNNMIKELIKYNTEKNKLIDICDLTYTYDGVHYTQEGHEKIYKRIMEGIKI